MNLLEILGCIGGFLYLTDWICTAVSAIIKWRRKYAEYKRSYEEHNNDAGEPEKKMGFKSMEDKRNEKIEELEKTIKELKTKDAGYFNMYWGTETVDDEFIEEEGYEDWDDKYPDLHVER